MTKLSKLDKELKAIEALKRMSARMDKEIHKEPTTYPAIHGDLTPEDIELLKQTLDEFAKAQSVLGHVVYTTKQAFEGIGGVLVGGWEYSDQDVLDLCSASITAHSHSSTDINCGSPSDADWISISQRRDDTDPDF